MDQIQHLIFFGSNIEENVLFNPIIKYFTIYNNFCWQHVRFALYKINKRLQKNFSWMWQKNNKTFCQKKVWVCLKLPKKHNFYHFLFKQISGAEFDPKTYKKLTIFNQKWVEWFFHIKIEHIGFWEHIFSILNCVFLPWTETLFLEKGCF